MCSLATKRLLAQPTCKASAVKVIKRLMSHGHRGNTLQMEGNVCLGTVTV